ncbi:hypothetical protein PYE51_16980 [Vibrio aestuarianus]|uniref:Uncharacterized protein n=1 Tax=Vibrio aestuarianus TaxID=28171 RepID=A0AAX3U7X5_9VIBR|nr:hypothetical protein [Vibrio aestuarianus]WGK83064.1 hypothetical protein PYE51_16980 [Vibrio aestuarianus]
MSSKDDAYRESQMRLHRVLGTYLALVAWKRKADGVVINRESLLSFLKISRMQNVRVDWMKEDLAHLFPYTGNTYFSKTGSYSALYLLRQPLPKGILHKTMSTSERIKVFKDNGLKVIRITPPDEKELIKKVALITSGLEAV